MTEQRPRIYLKRETKEMLHEEREMHESYSGAVRRLIEAYREREN